MIPMLQSTDVQALKRRVMERSQLQNDEISARVKEIVARVRAEGDVALFDYTARFDHVQLTADTVKVTREEIDAAYAAASPEWLAAMREAARRITAFHEKQKQNTWIDFQPGIALGQKITPLDRVGVYVPGGTAAYPSSVLMNVLPARVAGVREIVMVTPPGRDGGVSYPLALVAADLLSQAEHDPFAAAILVTDSAALAQAVDADLERQTALLPRRETVLQSLGAYGTIVIAPSLSACAEIANQIAPEHLELFVREPYALLPAIRNAGAIFLGRWSPEPLGDYFAGPNHVLPTSGTARFFSPLSVDDFVKKAASSAAPGRNLKSSPTRSSSLPDRRALTPTPTQWLSVSESDQGRCPWTPVRALP